MIILSIKNNIKNSEQENNIYFGFATSCQMTEKLKIFNILIYMKNFGTIVSFIVAQPHNVFHKQFE